MCVLRMTSPATTHAAEVMILSKQPCFTWSMLTWTVTRVGHTKIEENKK